MSDQKKNSSCSVLLSLGSNIKPDENILAALKLLSEIDSQLRISTIWESAAVGSSGPNYLNCAALLSTHLSRDSFKTVVISPLENSLGRVRSSDKFMDRTIDVDILIYDKSVIDPEIWTQAHLAVPASELLPDFINSTTGETLYEVAQRLREKTGLIPRSTG